MQIGTRPIKNFYLNQTWIFLKQENQLWMKDYQKKF